ncbi:MAG: enoyl-[acyl-carrier protein] reductase [Oceanotoga sp.]|uniref:nitronate monooxygenase n=1 Tax=Oceanotoga sp. TaxID=2108366 RepID=UPI00265482E4|nr:nitronate monooxygenase [Oceanotoga sp.]MDN5341300.1 enoyl-[acyl-carrier protein] reductase [Oceanotoga sp.]
MDFSENSIVKLLNIKYPIIEGGMAWVGTAKLAAEVSNAGGLGTIGSGSMTPDILKEQIKKIKELTNKPYAVNIIMINPFIEDIINIVIEEKVPVVIMAAGNPGKYIPILKSNNIITGAVVSSENLALRLEKKGIDFIVGEGMECGGHIGDVTTMVIIPKLASILKIPVIAAGGIADGRGMAAVFMLGASGIQMGTRFIASYECEAHENYKNKILKAGIRDSVITGIKMGHPARSIKNKFVKNINKIESESIEEAERLLIGSLKKAHIDGDNDNGSFMAGQSVGLIENIKSVKEIIEDLCSDMDYTIKNFSGVLSK